jgi:hypothetical protein
MKRPDFYTVVQVIEKLILLGGVVFFSAMLTSFAIKCAEHQGF